MRELGAAPSGSSFRMRGPVSVGMGSGECNRDLGRELTGEEERLRSGYLNEANVKELFAWQQFRVYKHVKADAPAKVVFDTRCVLPWRDVDGAKTMRARPAAEGVRDLDRKEGNADTAGRVSRRSSHLQLLFLGGL